MHPARPAPSFGLSRWDAPGDDEAELRVGRAREGSAGDAAVAAACLAAEAIVCGRPARGWGRR